jgi:hypothetical protein
MAVKRLVKDWKWASTFKMPYGVHAGRTLDSIASDDDGLRYLDWMRGEKDAEEDGGMVAQALRLYLDDPAIKRELNG